MTSQRRCALCGGTQRFSHRSYAGGGAAMAVFRCTTCGTTSAAPVPQDSTSSRPRQRSRKAPVDEGPPANPVLDPETARRLLEG
jgi:hypothetical protein